MVFVKKILDLDFKYFLWCQSVGSVFNSADVRDGRIYGNIGIIKTSKDERATFQLDDNVVKLSALIGRSFIITDQTKINLKE